MSSRQRSFFDTKPSHHNQSWQANRRPRYPTNPTNEAPPRPAPAKPPIMPSSQSRSKLKAFQFMPEQDQTITAMDAANIIAAEKENVGPSQGGKDTDNIQSTPVQAMSEFPRTPAARVPLADLIGNSIEDPFEQPPNPTPMERVVWKHSPSDSDRTLPNSTPNPRRGKKRARSSSPASSGKPKSPGRASFNVQNLQASLKTPQIDPAGELERRYFSMAKHTTPSKPPSSAAADIMHSSPQTPAFGLTDSAKLRRTMSCGMAWPMSYKRRKINQGPNDQQQPAQTIGNGGDQIGPRRIQYLLEEIQNELPPLSQRQRQKTPTSSSPVQSIHVRQVTKVRFTSQNVGHGNMDPDPEPSPDVTASTPKDSHQINHDVADISKKPHDEFDEFDDDEMDDMLMNSMDVYPMPAPTRNLFPTAQGPQGVPQQPQARTLDHAHPAVIEQSVVEVESPMSLPAIARDATTEEPYGRNREPLSDEFGDDDFEDADFAADIEKVAMLYDTQRPGGQVMSHQTDDRHIKATREPVSHRPAASKTSTKNPDPLNITCVEISSDEEFGDDFDVDDMISECEQVEMAGGKSIPTRNRTIQRYLIVTVTEGQHLNSNGRSKPEKILLVEEEKTKRQRAVMLRDVWVDLSCTAGSYVHIIGEFNDRGQCIIDNANNMLILHPDHLISATVVADSFSCIRRAVLQDRVKATSEANGPQVYGHILHEIFQEAMKANKWDTEWMSSTVLAVASRYLETLFEINIELNNAVEHLMSKIPELQAWAKIFVTARPKPNGLVQDRNGVALMSINKLLDVEEHVWSPQYGLKGNIDATVQVLMKDGGTEKTLTIPLELKTGRNTSNEAHRAQTALYTLLLSDRYDLDIACGILYYMETSDMHRILGVRNELMHMIMQRNQLAGYIRDRLQLPPMLQRPHLCNRCYAQTACFTYHKLVEDGNSETSGLKEKFDDMVQHLKPIHQEFFKKWDDLITKEEGDVLKFRRELWTMLSSEREKLGRCFGAVIIEPGSAAELPDGPKINRFQYAFMKKDQGPSFSFTESQITVGEPIVISDEAGHYALANGYVTKVRRERITVAVDRRLHNTRIRNKDFDAVRNQSFAGLMEVTDIWNPKPSSIGQEPEEPVLYRLDKDEFSNGMATVRNNLIRIMEKNLFGALPLRRLIVEGVPPTFSKKPIPRDIIHAAAKTSLNVDQQNAIEKVMQAKDYALVLGMPGTGKTTTIAQIIRTLAAQGKSILLTSYTHTAVDNILLKIRDSGIGILRIGAIAKVHPEVQEFADLASVPKTTVDELEKSYSNQIVATTCLGINHPIFNQRIFDYCIVDEASQITLPVCLGPIRMARTFILVGDHYQLPPLVQNKEAQKGGLDISLFKLLSDKHPESVVNLEHQYRMCEEIMSLSNGLIYDGRLKCGTNEVASRKLNIPNITGLQAHHHKRETLSQAQIGFCPGSSMGSCWLRDMLDPSQPVVFLNTDPLLPVSREIAKGARVTNPLEVALATQIVETLLSVGIAPNDVGVITLYRSQLALLKQSLRRRGGGSSYAPSSGGSVEMHTADKFQGRDKEVVLLSLVRSNDSNNIGDLLKDWRRVNVALTRARTKLIIIGSFETISKGNELLSNFCAMIEKNLWRMDLRPGALESHLFDDSITQCSITAAPVAQGTQSKNVDIKSQNSQSKRALGIKRVPDKTGKLDAWTLLKTRPVMRDIANEVMS